VSRKNPSTYLELFEWNKDAIKGLIKKKSWRCRLGFHSSVLPHRHLRLTDGETSDLTVVLVCQRCAFIKVIGIAHSSPVRPDKDG
jgi:hypothetical protein